MKKSDKPIIVEHTFNVSLETLWNAITQLKEMQKWYFENIPAFEPKVGFKTQFNIQNEGRNFLHLWEVTEAVPLKIIKYNWNYMGYSGDSFVAFELFKEGDLIHLKLTHTITKSFPDDVPEFKRESCVAGWTFFINERLKDYLEKSNM